jgi:hypothetical protein
MFKNAYFDNETMIWETMFNIEVQCTMIPLTRNDSENHVIGNDVQNRYNVFR